MKTKILFLLILLGATANAQETPAVLVGADLLLTKQFDLIKGKRVALVVNHTSVLSDGQHLADALAARTDVKLTALFGPEHGIRGDTTGNISDTLDPVTKVPVYSLYGKTYKPTPEMLAGIDVLVFDIQDVGARFYTYISTLGYALEAAAEKGIPMIVLDRPNPIGGVQVEGPVMEDSLKSFVGFAKIPIRHGMTIGELALMYNGQGWLAGGVRARLYVVRMENWRRTMWYDQTGLRWVKPSPNMISLATATVYPGTCLFEGVNVSEGRGSDHPFEYIGAPWLKSAQVLETLAHAQLKGVKFETVQFTPTKRPAGAGTPKFSGQGCNGISLHVVDRQLFEPVKAGLYLVWAIRALQPEKFEWRDAWFDRLCGTADVRKMLAAGKTPEETIARWSVGLDDFKRVRAKYLLYQ